MAGESKTVWQAYKSIPPQTRMIMGMAGFALSVAGMYWADYEEKRRPVTEDEWKKLPIRIETVERLPEAPVVLGSSTESNQKI
ncbi:hypothetical protein YB2330_004102 [Saitoella coloradoensis]